MGIDSDDSHTLCKDPRIVKFILSEIAKYQTDIAELEKKKSMGLRPNKF